MPQKHLSDNPVGYARGKGLGGSSAINFCFYTRGAKDDFDEWARRVDDDFFSWKNAERRFKRFEGYQPTKNVTHAKYADWKPENHGTKGPVKISAADEWEGQLENAYLAAGEEGWPSNLDINSGDPLGFGVEATTGHKWHRTTARNAYLADAPPNLMIVTDAPASKVLFDGKRAIGIQAGGNDYLAQKEVILSAGALDTPKLLMLSGVGPKAELNKHNIPIVADLPVGVGLQDHLHVTMCIQIKDGADQRAAWSTPEATEAARKQLALDGTGPLSTMYNSALVGFSKGSPSVYSSEEFNSLPEDVRTYLQRSTVPSYEFSAGCPAFYMDPTKTYASALAFNMAVQSRGNVTLKSADPNDPPVSDPNFMSHPFDRLTMIDGVRRVHKWLTHPLMSPEPVAQLQVPKSDSDEDILDFIQKNGQSTQHMSCTCRMGKASDEAAVVTTDFKVKGLEGLRIVDMSVAPLLPNCHTVSTAYLIGETAAERMIAELDLDSAA